MGEGRQSWLPTFKSIGDCSTWSQVPWQWGGLLIEVCYPDSSASPWGSACLPACVPQSLLSLPGLPLDFKRRNKLNWKVRSGFAIINLVFFYLFSMHFWSPPLHSSPLSSPPFHSPPSPSPPLCDMLSSVPLSICKYSHSHWFPAARVWL